jgi:antitoxin MazE
MRVAIKRWGNSAAVRIPTSVMQAAHLDLDQEVDVREEGGSIVMTPVQRPTYDLALLLEGITDDNLHGEISTGEAVGREAW